MKTQNGQVKFSEVIAFRKKTIKKHPNFAKSYGVLPKELKDVTIKCKLTQNKRKFTNGVGNSINKVIFEIDLSKSKHPWKPHMYQASDFAESMTDFINGHYQEYLDFCAEQN